jgi:hypothetical protein
MAEASLNPGQASAACRRKPEAIFNPAAIPGFNDDRLETARQAIVATG